WFQDVAEYFPMSAGSLITDYGSNGAGLSPWEGFGVLAIYVVVALAAAAVLLRRRDASAPSEGGCRRRGQSLLRRNPVYLRPWLTTAQPRASKRRRPGMSTPVSAAHHWHSPSPAGGAGACTGCSSSRACSMGCCSCWWQYPRW